MSFFDDYGMTDPFDFDLHGGDWKKTTRHHVDPSGALGVGDFSTSSPNNADQMAAQVTREQWQHFLDTYRPVESDVLRTAMSNDYSAQGDEAGVTARQSVTAAAGMAERNLSRSGVRLSDEERSAVRRRRSMSLTKAVGRAENTTRRTLAENRNNVLTGLVGIGRGIAQTASGGLNAAADMAAQRQVGNDARRAQAQQQNMQMAATIAMIAMSSM